MRRKQLGKKGKTKIQKSYRKKQRKRRQKGLEE